MFLILSVTVFQLLRKTSLGGPLRSLVASIAILAVALKSSLAHAKLFFGHKIRIAINRVGTENVQRREAANTHGYRH